MILSWKVISIAHVITIIKSEVFTYPIVIIFSMVVCLRCLLHHILSLIAYTFREKPALIFIIIVQFMMSANSRIPFCLTYRTRLFVQNTISLSSLCKLIWRHWTYKMPVEYIVEGVSKIKHILSVIHYAICGAVCFSLLIPLVMIERIYIYFFLLSSSNWKYELLPIVQY